MARQATIVDELLTLRGEAHLMLPLGNGYGVAVANSPSLLFAALIALVPASASAAESKVPYWASLRVNEVNMRSGPSEEYQTNWVYRRMQLPLKVLRLKEGWRLVEDPDGTKGWVLAQFLTRERGAIVTGTGLADMREQGNEGAKLLWRLQPGVTGKLGECAAGWCRFGVGKRVGFVEQARLWGAGEP